MRQIRGHGWHWTELAPLREVALAIVHRTHTWAEVPALAAYRNAAQFIPVMEISIERQHAMLHGRIRAAPHHPIAFASIQGLRKEELLSAIEDTPAEGERLVEMLKTTRTPTACLEVVDLLGHPDVAQYMDADEGKLKSVPHQVACDVIYRHDLTTQFADLPDMSEAPPGPPGDRPLRPSLHLQYMPRGGPATPPTLPPDGAGLSAYGPPKRISKWSWGFCRWATQRISKWSWGFCMLTAQRIGKWSWGFCRWAAQRISKWSCGFCMWTAQRIGKWSWGFCRWTTQRIGKCSWGFCRWTAQRIGRWSWGFCRWTAQRISRWSCGLCRCAAPRIGKWS